MKSLKPNKRQLIIFFILLAIFLYFSYEASFPIYFAGIFPEGQAPKPVREFQYDAFAILSLISLIASYLLSIVVYNILKFLSRFRISYKK